MSIRVCAAEDGRSGCRNMVSVHTGNGQPKTESCLGGSPQGDRLMERSWVRERSVRADAAYWGMSLTVTDDLRWNAAWEGAHRATVSWNETTVCVRSCVKCSFLGFWLVS